MNDDLKTTEDFLKFHTEISYFFDEKTEQMVCYADEVKKAMVEFAQIHVKAALKAVADADMDDLTEWSGNPFTGEGSDYLSEKKIARIYPLELIK